MYGTDESDSPPLQASTTPSPHTLDMRYVGGWSSEEFENNEKPRPTFRGTHVSCRSGEIEALAGVLVSLTMFVDLGRASSKVPAYGKRPWRT